MSDFLGDIARCRMSSNLAGEYRLAKIGQKGQLKASFYNDLSSLDPGLKGCSSSNFKSSLKSVKCLWTHSIQNLFNGA